MEPHLYGVILAGCVLLLIAVLSGKLAQGAGLPVLLLYLGLGVALGEAGLGLRFGGYRLTTDVGLVALALLLAEGGLTTRWERLRPALPHAVLLATVGIVVSTCVVAGVASLLPGVDLRTALLLGVVVSSTDAAAVFSVLRTLPLIGRLGAVLEAESGLNDAPAVVLVTVLSAPGWASTSGWAVLGTVVTELLGGLAAGLVVGRLGRELLARAALPAAGLYPLATLALVLLAWSAAGAVHVSGFLSAYVAAVVLANAHLPHRRAVLGFASSVALLAEAALFVLLGLLASPARLLPAVLPALAIGAAATFLARPLAVLVTSLPLRVPWRHQVFLSWAGLRGAVPIVLATVAVSGGVPQADRVLDVVFVLVVVYTLVQAPSLPWLGRRLGVVDTFAASDLEVEVAPLDRTGTELLEVQVPTGSRLHGVYVTELRLPPTAHVALVVRAGTTFVPDLHTQLLVHDTFLVVTTAQQRRVTEVRLRAVGRDGKLAGWLARL